MLLATLMERGDYTALPFNTDTKNGILQLHEYLSRLPAYEASRQDKTKRIYRGLRNERGIHIQDTTTTRRAAANTYNYLNALTETLPSWNGWPARSSGVSCSTTTQEAFGYGNLHAVIPFPDAQLVYLGAVDFWNAFPSIELMTDQYSIDQIAANFSGIHQILYKHGIMNAPRSPVDAKTSMELIKNVDLALDWQTDADDGDELYAQLEKIPVVNGFINSGEESFIDFINKMMDPSHFTKSTGANLLPRKVVAPGEEVFISGKVVYIPLEDWKQLLAV